MRSGWGRGEWNITTLSFLSLVFGISLVHVFARNFLVYFCVFSGFFLGFAGLVVREDPW